MADNKCVFLDTSGWIAILNADDRFHISAVEQMQQLGAVGRPLVTTDWVVAEMGNGLARTGIRTQFVRADGTFLRSSSGRLLRIDERTFHQALELYAQVTDKTWELVDCASFVVMREEGITRCPEHRPSLRTVCGR